MNNNEYFILKFQGKDSLIDFSYESKGEQMEVLCTAISCEKSDFFDYMKKTIIDLGQSGTGGNVTCVDITNGIATISLDPVVFGYDCPVFQTDEAQFKYMIEEFVRLKDKGALIIMITRDEKGVISVVEQ